MFIAVNAVVSSSRCVEVDVPSAEPGRGSSAAMFIEDINMQRWIIRSGIAVTGIDLP